MEVGDCMFMGEYNHKIDTKGRLIVPSKFRELFGEQFVVTRGLDGCLVGYSMDRFKAIRESLEEQSAIDEDVRELKRFLFGAAAICEIDEHGRTLVPASLRNYAQIDKEVILNGVVDCVEIWSKEMFDAKNTFSDINMIAKKLSERTAIKL